MIDIHEVTKKYENKMWLFLLLVIAVISHWEWFHFGNILSYGDSWFWYSEKLREGFLSNTWIEYSSLGILNVELYKLLFMVIWPFLEKVNLQFTGVIQVTHLIPIAIFGFVSPYVLIGHFTREKSIAFVGALFYGSTTPFLVRQSGHLSIAFVIALAPLILYIFLLALEKNTIRQWIIFVLVYWVGMCYEPRITYVVTIILGTYFLFFGIKLVRKIWTKIIMSVVLLIGLNLFWVLPIILGNFSGAIYDIAGRDLFLNSHYSIMRSFPLFQPMWTGEAAPSTFALQPVSLYLWIIPIFTIIFFFFRPDKKNKKTILFFGTIWLLGLFLTKQAGPPLSDAFQWLRENIPGFLVFRSGSKFWFVSSLGCMGLLSFGLLWLKKRGDNILEKTAFMGISISIIILSFLNLRPLIMGTFGGMFAEREIPNDYIVLKEYLVQQRDFSRTFWTPASSRWGFYSNGKPAISEVIVIDSDWKNLFENYNENEKLIQERIMNFFEFPSANNLLDVSSIQYVVVPIHDFANDDDFYIYYGGVGNPSIRQWYIEELDKVDFLKKIDIGTEELVVYENENFKPHIYSTKEKETIYSDVSFEKVDFEQKNPTEYSVHLKNISHSFYLNFSESFHPDWKIRVGDFDWFDVLKQKNYFLTDESHKKNSANLNYWYLDLASVCAKDGDCVKNPDGSYNIELTLYFKPQSYFYLGLIVSGTTLFGCLGYLGYDFARRRKKAKKN